MNLWVRYILRTAVYQIYDLKVPDYASCDQAVNLGKKFGHKGISGFINGVLRSVIRNKGKVKFPLFEQDPLTHISVAHSHPKWMVEKWCHEYGIEATESLCMANNEIPMISIRTNLRKISREELILLMRERGIDAEKSVFVPEGILAKRGFYPAQLEQFTKGYFSIQDEASIMVSRVLNPLPGENVLDVCGGPGGKSVHIGELMDNVGKIVSCDIYPHKMRLIEKAATRCGIDIIETKKIDAREISSHFEGFADKILVDPPCSGLGTIRRRPDIKWKKKPEDVFILAKLQKQILKEASKCLRSGGVLVYSVCTIEPEETEQIVDWFLSENNGFYLETINRVIELERSKGCIHLLPSINGTDGFFISLIRKK